MSAPGRRAIGAPSHHRSPALTNETISYELPIEEATEFTGPVAGARTIERLAAELPR